MQLHADRHLVPAPVVREQRTNPSRSNHAEPQPPDGHGLASCVYIGLHCAHCGEVRQALRDLPAGETAPCPECGIICSFSRLGTGLTSREIPFHELPSRDRQSINPADEPPVIAHRFPQKE